MLFVYSIGMTNAQTTPLFFVSSSVVAGRLMTVMQIAREISLAAKNAKAIAERAGEKANSFKPITDFIDEMGRETIQLVGLISEQSLIVSRSTVTLLRMVDADTRFARSEALLNDHERVGSIQKISHQLHQDVILQQKKLKSEVTELLSLLDRISTCMRASGVISTRSRVEAVQAGDFQESLVMVAETIERASEQIKRITDECESKLRNSQEYEMKA